MTTIFANLSDRLLDKIFIKSRLMQKFDLINEILSL